MTTYISKEERRERELEQQALRGVTPHSIHSSASSGNPTPQPNSNNNSPSPFLEFDHYNNNNNKNTLEEDVEIQNQFFSQQRLRIEVYEHNMRNSLVVAEASTFTQKIQNPWKYSDLSVRLHMKALEESESTWRAAVERETALTMDRLYKILNRIFEDAVEKYANADVETEDVKHVKLEEKEFRKMIHEHSVGAAAVVSLQIIDPQEKAWRHYIWKEYSEESKKLWSVVLGAQFLWLMSPAGGAGGVLSEADSRQRIMRQEWFSRASAAIRFCQLQLQWHEEWQRMTRQFVEKIDFHYTRLSFKIWTDEMHERKALMRLYEPFSADIKEQVEENMMKKKRIENKMTALKNLRQVELARSSAARFESDDYVTVWRARELAEIESLHNQVLMSVAKFYTQKDNNSGGFENEADDLLSNNNNNMNDNSAMSRRRRAESPALQKLRAFASSLSPQRAGNNNNSSTFSPSPNRPASVAVAAGGDTNKNNNSRDNDPSAAAVSFFNSPENIRTQVLKLDHALVDLHSHHQDVLQRLSQSTTAFDEIVQYRKNLQAKSGPKLSAKAESEVKHLRGVLDSEIAQLQKQGSLRRKNPLAHTQLLREASQDAKQLLDEGNLTTMMMRKRSDQNGSSISQDNDRNAFLTSENLQLHETKLVVVGDPSNGDDVDAATARSQRGVFLNNNNNNNNNNNPQLAAEAVNGGRTWIYSRSAEREQQQQATSRINNNTNNNSSSPVYDDDASYYSMNHQTGNNNNSDSGLHHHGSSNNTTSRDKNSLEAVRNWCLQTATSHLSK